MNQLKLLFGTRVNVFLIFLILLLQMPKPVPLVSLCAPTESAWPSPTCATVMMTAGTAATSWSAPPLWPAGRTTSAATPRSVCRSCGAATETPTAPTAPTRGRSAAVATGRRTCCSTDGPTARLRSFGVPTASVWGWHGNVTATQTARTNLMSLTVVSVTGNHFKSDVFSESNFHVQLWVPEYVPVGQKACVLVFSWSACPQVSWEFGVKRILAHRLSFSLSGVV